jgi:ABC-type lipoprotein export system ATPase subunit
VTAGTCLVTASAVTRIYRGSGPGIAAVCDASLVVEPGARIGLTGSSGSGKSTLLYLMAGLDSPTSGTIRWPAWDGSPGVRPQHVGMVFQGHSLVPTLDVFENIALPLLLAGRESAARRRAAQVAKQLGVDNVMTKLPREISGGQAQRVAIARAIAAEPALILADEPTGQLDHATAALVIDVLLRASSETGAALVVATHDPAVARRLPDQWMMQDGCLDTGVG